MKEISLEDALTQHSSIVPRGHISEPVEMTRANCRDLLEDVMVNKGIMSEQQLKMLQDLHTTNIR